MDTTIRTSVVPTDLHHLIDAYRTCELATMGKDGTPVAWPVMAVRDPVTGGLTVTTSIGFPGKAFNIRRDPRVSLLFSEPAGSGLECPPHVLVQGTATCSDEVVTDPAGMEDYWRTLYRRQPAGSMYGANALTRRFFDWYYFRLVIRVTPENVTVREGGPSHAMPGKGASTPVDLVHVPGHGLGYTLARDAARRLRGYPTAVLTTVGADGPCSRRVMATPCGDGFELQWPEQADGIEEGPASLLCHRHDERTWSLSSVVLTGQVSRRDEITSFQVARVVPGASQNPVRLVRMMRGGRAAAGRYLERRGLTRPVVPWSAYARLAGKDSAKRGRT